MDWQQILALGIVVVTAAICLRRRFRPRQFMFHPDTHCGCAAPDPSLSQGSIVFHARKGERPEVVVKMR